MEIAFSTENKGGFIIKNACFGEEKYFFKVPDKYETELTGLADPFVILLIFRMMRQGGEFFVKGKVSSSLLDNLELYVSCWNKLIPRLYKKIRITADEEIKDDPKPLADKAVACFSGGIDSAFMLYRHKKGLAGRNGRNIEKGVFLAGADIALDEKERFEKSFNMAQKMCEDFAVELIPAQLNYRYYPHNWEMEHMTFMTAALRFWKNYPYQMFGSSAALKTFTYPWGTNPVTDRFLSSNNFKVIIDDINFNRMEKASLIKDWKTCVENLVVCWYGGEKENIINCGKCEKCVRTYLNFRASGIKELSCMHEKFDAKNFDGILMENKTKYYYEALEYASKNGIEDEAFKKLAKTLRKNEKKERRKRFDYLRSLALLKLTFGRKKIHYINKAQKLSKGKDHTQLVCMKP